MGLSAIEKCKKNNGKIIENKNDVLCGRGSGVNAYPGNVKFRELVKARKAEYKNAKRHLKIPITKEIIQCIKNLDPPGRFLVRDETNEWREYTEEQAMVKTAQALREGATKNDRPKFRTQPKIPNVSLHPNHQSSAIHMGQNLLNTSPTFNAMQDVMIYDERRNRNIYPPPMYSMERPIVPTYPQSPKVSDAHSSFNPYERDMKKDKEVLHQHCTMSAPNNVFPYQISIGYPANVFPEDRFDDAEENLDISIRTFLNSVQMRRLHSILEKRPLY